MIRTTGADNNGTRHPPIDSSHAAATIRRCTGNPSPEKTAANPKWNGPAPVYGQRPQALAVTRELNDYCRVTHTDCAGVVGNSWTGLGIMPPSSDCDPLPAGKPVRLCDGFVRLSTIVPQDDRAVARTFLDMLAEVYLRLPRPGTTYRGDAGGRRWRART